MQWLQLHVERGIDHFIFYDAGGVNEILRDMLRVRDTGRKGQVAG